MEYEVKWDDTEEDGGMYGRGSPDAGSSLIQITGSSDNAAAPAERSPRTAARSARVRRRVWDLSGQGLRALPVADETSAASSSTSAAASLLRPPLVPAALQELWLTRNRLSLVPRSIATSFGNLTTLGLAHNQLTELTPAVAQLKHLARLVLSHNRLVTLPAALGTMRHMRELYVDGNQLETVPECVPRIRGLVLLSCNANRLTSLPGDEALRQVGATLAHLYLDGNRIAGLPERGLAALMPKLEVVSLEGNLLSASDVRNGLSGLPNLQLMQVSGNCPNGLLVRPKDGYLKTHSTRDDMVPGCVDTERRNMKNAVWAQRCPEAELLRKR